MAKWEHAVVTNDGLSLQAKLGSGSTLVFKKVKTGAGSVPAVLLQQQTDVTNPKQEFLFSDNPYYLTEPGAAELSFTIANDSLTESYSCYQLGIYAEDPDKGEILYAILQTSSAMEIPTPEQDVGWSTEFNVALQYSNAETVSVYVNASGPMSRQVADKRYMKKVRYQGKMHELVWDETGVWLKEVEEDNSGEATEVSTISETDWIKLHELFIDEDELAKAIENLAPVFTINNKSPDENGKITLNASDVGAYTKEEVNSAISNIKINVTSDVPMHLSINASGGLRITY